MPAGTEHIYMQCLHVDGNLPESLDRVSMEQYPVFFGNGADFFYRFYGADLIVGKHDADQYGIRPDCRPKLPDVHQSVLIHLKIRNLTAFFFQILTGMQNGMMLDSCGDNMSSLPGAGFGCRLQRPVIRLRASGGKIDFLLLCPNGGRYGPLCLVYRLFGGRPQGIDCAGISVLFTKIRQHCLHHLRRCFCSSCIVQIDHRHPLSLHYAHNSYCITGNFLHNIAFPARSVNCPQGI